MLFNSCIYFIIWTMLKFKINTQFRRKFASIKLSKNDVGNHIHLYIILQNTKKNIMIIFLKS